MRKIFLPFAALLLISAVSSCRHLPIDPHDPDPIDTVYTGKNLLAGTNWELVENDSFYTGQAKEIFTLKFSSETEAGGQAACNTYGVKYKATDKNISFSDLISTKAYCGDNSYDKHFFSNLEMARSYKVEGDYLTLFQRPVVTTGDGITIELPLMKFVRVRENQTGEKITWNPVIQWLDFSVVKMRNHPFKIVGSRMIGESQLGIMVEFGGGCASHNFVLYADKHYSISEEKMDINFMLIHDTPGDPCDAWFRKELIVDISPVLEKWQGGYCQGNLNVSISGYNQQLNMSFTK